MNYEIRWTENAVNQLNSILNYFEEFSETLPNQILDEIIALADSLIEMPFRYPECKELPTKAKIYRSALYQKKYRIVYRVAYDEVVILGIIHTSRNPSEIKKLKTIR
jgi:plasmid stabilization system protein ParE